MDSSQWDTNQKRTRLGRWRQGRCKHGFDLASRGEGSYGQTWVLCCRRCRLLRVTAIAEKEHLDKVVGFAQNSVDRLLGVGDRRPSLPPEKE